MRTVHVVTATDRHTGETLQETFDDKEVADEHARYMRASMGRANRVTVREHQLDELRDGI